LFLFLDQCLFLDQNLFLGAAPKIDFLFRIKENIAQINHYLQQRSHCTNTTQYNNTNSHTITQQKMSLKRTSSSLTNNNTNEININYIESISKKLKVNLISK
jgi:phosphoglycerate-specific signal transduction histidine kinase